MGLQYYTKIIGGIIFLQLQRAGEFLTRSLWMVHRDWLNNLKLRVGWGITGSAKIDPYSSVAIVENTNMSLGGVTQAIYPQFTVYYKPGFRMGKI